MADLLKTARKLLCILSTVMFSLIVINIAFLRHDSVSLHGLQYLNRRTTNISNKALMILSSAEFKETSGNKTLEPQTNRPHAVQYHGIDLMSLPKYAFDPAYKNPCWTEAGVLRCLPYFYLIGVKKCGTTDLFGRILRHPDVVTGGVFYKEAQWFARKRFHGKANFTMYVDLFKNASRKIEENYAILPETSKKYHPLITGEGSPSNLHLNSHWQFLPGNEHLEEPKYVILDYIHHFLPKAKMIIIFRDPIERLYSDYYHEMGLRRHLNVSATPEHFHQAVVEGLEMYTDCFLRHTLRACIYNRTIYDKTAIQMQLGIYHVYWKELTRLFPRDQILVLQNKDCRNSSATMSKVSQFLELSPCTKDIWSKITAEKPKKHTDREPMFPKTKRMLYEFYRPHNLAMYKLTGDRTFLYEQK